MPYCPACGFDSPSRDGRCAAGHPTPPDDAELVVAEPLFELPSEPLFDAPAEPLFETPPEPLFDGPAEPPFEAPVAPVFEVEPVFDAVPAVAHEAIDDEPASARPGPLEGASFTITLAPPKTEPHEQLASAVEEPAPVEPAPGRAGGRRVAIVVLAVAVLVAGAIGYVALGRGGGDGRSLARVFVPGETHRYLFETNVRGSSGIAGLSFTQEFAIRMELTEETMSVDSDDVATVRYTVDFADTTADGIPQPLGIDRGSSFTYRVGRDGRVVGSVGPRAELSGDVAPVAGLFDLGSLSPLLPDGTVNPGDSWTIEHEFDVPLSEKPVEALTEGTYVRDRDVGGHPTIVVRARTAVPLDFLVDFEQLFGSLGADAPGVPNISIDLQQRFSGDATLRTTSTILKDSARPIWIVGTATIDAKLSVAGEGLPTLPPGLGQDLTVDIEMSLRDLAYDEDVLRGGAPGAPSSDVSSGARTTYGKAVDRAENARAALEDRQDSLENAVEP